MVDSVTATIETVIAHNGELVQPIGADAPEITARFRDPAETSLAFTRSRAMRRLPGSGNRSDTATANSDYPH